MYKVGHIAMVAALIVMALPVGVQAQSAFEEVEIFTDSEGDAHETSMGTQHPFETGNQEASDVLALFIQEQASHIMFRIQVANVQPDASIPFFGGGRITIDFSLGEAAEATQESESDPIPTKYRIELFQFDGGAQADFERWDPTLERYVEMNNICDFCEDSVAIDTATNSYVIPVRRVDLLDSQGAAVAPGIDLHDFLVESQYQFLFNTPDGTGTLYVHDLMPDSGEAEGRFEAELGVKQTGHLHLSSPAPVRASNGEATTYVYDISLTSTGDFVDDVEISAVGLPDAWEIRMPAQSVRIDNATTISMPVLVTIPFAHEHGSYQSFVIQAQSARDPSAIGRVELGVRYTAIPQPAGHHATLWLHSSENSFGQVNDALNDVLGGSASYAYFNAADSTDDARDSNINIPPNRRGGLGLSGDANRPVDTTFGWDIYLEPTLQMGLDFDINGTGELTFPVQSPVGLQSATIEGTLYYARANQVSNPFFPEQDATILGTFATSEAQSASAGQPITFVTEFTPTPESDFLSYDRDGASVWMNIELTTLGSTTIFADGLVDPELLPGGEMTLPLIEYHDPVDDLYVTLTDVQVTMESPQERYVNSGETVLYEVRIENTGVVNDDFQLLLGGVNEEWATLLGDTEFPVRSHDSRRIVVAVAAPLSAGQGETVDLVLEAISKSDSNARALVRLYAEVDNLIDHPDQSHLVPITHEELTYVPVGNWLAPLSLLGALLVLRRRQS